MTSTCFSPLSCHSIPSDQLSLSLSSKFNLKRISLSSTHHLSSSPPQSPLRTLRPSGITSSIYTADIFYSSLVSPSLCPFAFCLFFRSPHFSHLFVSHPSIIIILLVSLHYTFHVCPRALFIISPSLQAFIISSVSQR